jgi:hypothetical protein
MSVPVISQPITFLNATVLSFNLNLGYGSTESTLNLQLVEDCNIGQSFLPKNPNSIYQVGAPVYFQAGNLNFGGLLSNWTENLSSGGYTITANIVDPRSVLENTIVVTDSYVGDPLFSRNYINAYAFYERNVFYTNENDCSTFGTSQYANIGMPYNKVYDALVAINAPIFTSTGYAYAIDWSSFLHHDPNQSVFIPQYYRVNGPAVSLLQLLQDACETIGVEFYVYAVYNTIRIGYIDLRNRPSSFSFIKTAFQGIATEISYGQEIRNEKTKTVILGEEQHYMTLTNRFDYFFGEDTYGTESVIITPYKVDECGFWIGKKIDSLNQQLDIPFSNNGPYALSEIDLRCAMSGFEIWKKRVMDKDIPGNNNPITLNYQIRTVFIDDANDKNPNEMVKRLNHGINTLGTSHNVARGIVDAINAPHAKGVEQGLPDLNKQLEIIHGFVKNLADTYYGKQYITPLNQKICYNYSVFNNNNFPLIDSEIVYSDLPTSNGAWVELGFPVLGLLDPELSLFRNSDNRLGCFIRFDNDPLELGIDGVAQSGTGNPYVLPVSNNLPSVEPVVDPECLSENPPEYCSE